MSGRLGGTHPSQRRYPREIRERAVRMVLDAIERTGEPFGVVTTVARELHIGAESLRTWVRAVQVYDGKPLAYPGILVPTALTEPSSAADPPAERAAGSWEGGLAPGVKTLPSCGEERPETAQ